MQTHQFDIVGILKAFVIVLSITSVSAAFAASLKTSSGEGQEVLITLEFSDQE